MAAAAAAAAASVCLATAAAWPFYMFRQAAAETELRRSY
jgi:hypothetical protein